jgi:hypothetical protein
VGVIDKIIRDEEEEEEVVECLQSMNGNLDHCGQLTFPCLGWFPAEAVLMPLTSSLRHNYTGLQAGQLERGGQFASANVTSRLILLKAESMRSREHTTGSYLLASACNRGLRGDQSRQVDGEPRHNTAKDL